MKTKSLDPRPTVEGAVLLEVILALVLFAAAATIIGNSLTSAMESVERQRLSIHAVNLAGSVLAEIQLGIRSSTAGGPEAFEKPFDHWTWQLVPVATETEAGESSDLTRLEVVVRHDDPTWVHRLTQVLKVGQSRPPTPSANLPL